MSCGVSSPAFFHIIVQHKEQEGKGSKQWCWGQKKEPNKTTKKSREGTKERHNVKDRKGMKWYPMSRGPFVGGPGSDRVWTRWAGEKFGSEHSPKFQYSDWVLSVELVGARVSLLSQKANALNLKVSAEMLIRLEAIATTTRLPVWFENSSWIPVKREVQTTSLSVCHQNVCHHGQLLGVWRVCRSYQNLSKGQLSIQVKHVKSGTEWNTTAKGVKAKGGQNHHAVFVWPPP